MVTNHRRLNVLSELIHRCVGNTHVSEHSLHFGSVKTTTFCLWRRGDQEQPMEVNVNVLAKKLAQGHQPTFSFEIIFFSKSSETVLLLSSLRPRCCL